MEIALILARELAVVFLLVATGYAVSRMGLLQQGAASQLAGFLLSVIIPSMMIKSLQQPMQPQLMRGFWLTMGLAVVYHVVAILIATLCFRPQGEDTSYRVQRLAVVLSNCGFMAFPLLEATIGPSGLIYGAAFTGIFNIVNWTWAMANISGEKKITVRKVLWNPGFVGFAVGLGLFLLQIQLPDVLKVYFGYLTGINTPISMMCIGIFLAATSLRGMLADPTLYKVVFFRNILIPSVFLGILYLSGAANWFDGARTAVMATFIMGGCSSAASAILLPAKLGMESGYGAKLIATSTACCLVTLPLLTMVADRIL